MVDISKYLALKTFEGYNDYTFCEWMIRNLGVAAVPGSSFFREPVNHLIRLHFARSKETIDEALNRLARINDLI
jgi:aspartate/methionine/tyrosine aminotransferase